MPPPLREVEATYSSNDGGSRPPDPPTEILQPRGFQYEMLEESLRRNIIVALVWFLAPNVALATQQAEVIATQIPSVQTRLLLGSDNVQHWSQQWIWDGILDGIRIVISTYQVWTLSNPEISIPFLVDPDARFSWTL
ncbi:MAG: hypothetical protein Q9228_000316 [Teloschistes exilis]